MPAVYVDYYYITTKKTPTINKNYQDMFLDFFPA